MDSRRKAADDGGSLQRPLIAPAYGLLGHGSLVHVEVGVDVLRVVQIFQSFEQANHGVGLRAFELGVGRGDLRDLGVLGRRSWRP